MAIDPGRQMAVNAWESGTASPALLLLNRMGSDAP